MKMPNRSLAGLLSLLLTLALCFGAGPVLAADTGAVWDLMDADLGDYAAAGWNVTLPEGSPGVVTQEDGYVNIQIDAVGDRGQYVWLTHENTLPAGGFTMEVEARMNSAGSHDGGEVSVRLGQSLTGIFLAYGDETTGSVRSASDGGASMQLDTSQWHTYTLAVTASGAGYVSALYVDNTAAAWVDAASTAYTGGDLIRIGADNANSCDMDIRAIRFSSRILSYGISGVTLDSYSRDEGTASTLQVTADCGDYADGTPVEIALVRTSTGLAVEGVFAQTTVQEGGIAAPLALPADLAAGQYRVRVSIDALSALSDVFTVNLTRTRPQLPVFAAEGYTIEMEDYLYNPTEEFNFPSIVDAGVGPLPDGSRPLGRYYLFYAPHNNPGGICLATSDSLDGPWTEYPENPVVSNQWEGHYAVSHVSSGHVMWIEEQQKYVMYYHGENHQTRYATSENLVDWEYGDVILTANDFSPTGAGYTECSYARVFPYEVPGLRNKYIMTVMINDTANTRRIFWAHSPDGITWTAVQTPLLSPTTDQGYDYAGNLSGAYFFTLDDRCFVIAHGSTGDMYLFEVGRKLDEEIHWGVFYDSADGVPDSGRAGAPCFIRDDDGVWHMFYEGGVRLHANIVHAKQVIPLDTAALSQRIEELEALHLAEADYTADSWSAYAAALQAARELLPDTAAAQADIDAAVSDLQAAYDNLEPRPDIPPGPDDPDNPDPPEIVKGDMNGDGIVNVQDIMDACRVLARKNIDIVPGEQEMQRGDMNEDGEFQIDDIMAICRLLSRQQ